VGVCDAVVWVRMGGLDFIAGTNECVCLYASVCPGDA